MTLQSYFWVNNPETFLCDCRRDICKVFISPLFVIAEVEVISLEEKTIKGVFCRGWKLYSKCKKWIRFTFTSMDRFHICLNRMRVTALDHFEKLKNSPQN